MPRPPRTDRPPSTNGRSPDLEITISGEAGRKLTHLAERLGITPEAVLNEVIDAWPPVPSTTARS